MNVYRLDHELQFNSPSNLPDLIPMIFLSSDLFAHPMQLISSLENDHFKEERSGASATLLLFKSAY